MVSVIVPTLNSEKTIVRTLNSIFAQTYQNFEVIVVDNGSTDRTLKHIEKYKNQVRLVECIQRGAGPARNLGAQVACGKLLAFLDSDDFWLPSKLSEQSMFHETIQSWPLISGTYALFIGSNSRIVGNSPRTSDDNDAKASLISLGKMPAPLSTWILNREFFCSLGGFDDKYLVSQDLEFLIRAVNSGGQLKIIRKPLCLYSLSFESESGQRYIDQYLTSRYIIETQKCNVGTLEDFLNKNSRKVSNLYRKAQAGRCFRFSLIYFSSSQHMKAIKFAIFAFLLSPVAFITKIFNQRKLRSLGS